MADLVVYINEKITLDNVDRGVLTTQTITNVNGVANRVLSCPTGSETFLFQFRIDGGQSYAAFSTSSLKYGRLTNKSSNPVKLVIHTYDPITSASGYVNQEISSNSSYFLSSAKASGSLMSDTNFTYNQYISALGIVPSGSAATIEYFIATS